MKKVFVLVIALVIASFASYKAEAQTRIGKDHVVALGLHYGYGAAPVANMGGVNVDFNMASNNLRFRLDLDMLQRPYKGTQGAYSAALNVQYLFPMAKDDADGFYMYPTLGIVADMHKGLANWKGDYGYGVNAGIGAEYQFNETWGIFVEGNYQVRVKSNNQPVFRIGFEFAL